MIKMSKAIPLFFAGVTSGEGYISHLDKVYSPEDGWRTYLIKGGAGMGKSTLMKSVAAALMSEGAKGWLAPCPSDPDSLDAIIFPDIKACVMDATSPHIVNPVYPEVCEVTINLADHCNKEQLAPHSKDIISAFKQSSELYGKAYRYMSAASSLIADSYRVAVGCTDSAKAAAYGTHLAKRLLPQKLGRGAEQMRFLSAVTPKGLIFLSDTLSAMCDRLVIIEDEHGAVSRAILSAVRLTALEMGHNIITCTCPFAPNEKPEHIIIPELKIGFTTQNRYLNCDSSERKFHARRFTRASAISAHRQRLNFNRRAVLELIKGASAAIAQAKALHDDIEGYYIECMDFDAVNKRRDSIIAELKTRL